MFCYFHKTIYLYFATNAINCNKTKTRKPLFIEVSEFCGEVPGGFEPP